MPTIQIGRAEIAYELRRSAMAAERRITVTPGQVEVMALITDSDDDIAGFLYRKRQWLFNTLRNMEKISAARHSVPRWMTGSKILYRGRKMSLTVRHADVERIEIAYRNGFIVDLPRWVKSDWDKIVSTEIRFWLKQRARRDVRAIAAAYSKRFGLVPRSVQVTELEDGWGSCGERGNIRIHWHLIFAPRKVLEYVVVHELAHLKYRSHGPSFWQFLKIMLPDYSAPMDWLEQNQSVISADFLV